MRRSWQGLVEAEESFQKHNAWEGKQEAHFYPGEVLADSFQPLDFEKFFEEEHFLFT